MIVNTTQVNAPTGLPLPTFVGPVNLLIRLHFVLFFLRGQLDLGHVVLESDDVLAFAELGLELPVLVMDLAVVVDGLDLRNRAGNERLERRQRQFLDLDLLVGEVVERGRRRRFDVERDVELGVGLGHADFGAAIPADRRERLDPDLEAFRPDALGQRLEQIVHRTRVAVFEAMRQTGNARLVNGRVELRARRGNPLDLDIDLLDIHGIATLSPAFERGTNNMTDVA